MVAVSPQPTKVLGNAIRPKISSVPSMGQSPPKWLASRKMPILTAKVMSYWSRPRPQLVGKVFEGYCQVPGGGTGMIRSICKAFELTGVKIDWAVERHLPICLGEGVESFRQFIGRGF